MRKKKRKGKSTQVESGKELSKVNEIEGKKANGERSVVEKKKRKKEKGKKGFPQRKNSKGSFEFCGLLRRTFSTINEKDKKIRLEFAVFYVFFAPHKKKKKSIFYQNVLYYTKCVLLSSQCTWL
jgi:hypothetical protein